MAKWERVLGEEPDTPPYVFNVCPQRGGRYHPLISYLSTLFFFVFTEFVSLYSKLPPPQGLPLFLLQKPQVVKGGVYFFFVPKYKYCLCEVQFFLQQNQSCVAIQVLVDILKL